MTAPLPPRRRLVVVGNSLCVLVGGGARGSSTHTWPRLLEDRLRVAGIDVVVDNDARMFDLLPEGSRRYRRDGFARFPDVLLIQYGTVEMQPNVVPTWLNRHLTREVAARRGLEGRWYHHVVPRIWPRVRAWQRWASRRVGMVGWRVSPHRFGAELRRLVEVARRMGTHVVVFDVHAPGPRYRHFFPGIDARWHELQRTVHEVVASFDGDPAVHLFAASAITESFGDDHVPDGMHWAPPVHRAVAEELAELLDPVLREGSCP